MAVNDWVQDEGEVQRSVEAITEFVRCAPVRVIADFCVQRSPSVFKLLHKVLYLLEYSWHVL